MTHCNAPTLLFQDLDARQVLAAFDGGKVTSDGGGLLLREVDHHFRFLEQFARCFTDHRAPDRIEHTLLELLKQRVFGLCLGYEDLNDHDQLRFDPLLAVLVGKTDPLGEDRCNAADRGKALAGKSTLNRLELTAVGADTDTRYKKIVAHLGQIENFLVDVFVQQHVLPPRRLVLDLDATDDPVHGHQLGHFFHGYYDHDCFLPLYLFCGDHPLCAVLRPSDLDAAAGSLVYVQRLVTRLRQAWPDVAIVLRGDSGFCRDYLMRWCEANRVDYLFGLAKNARLLRIVGQELQQAKGQYEQTRQPARVFKDFEYRTHKSWSRTRRVVGKAEHLAKGSNPRFVVTSLSAADFDGRTLYEQEYWRGGTWKTALKSSSCGCSPTAPVAKPCVPIRCGCICRPWPTSCCGRCVNLACGGRSCAGPVWHDPLEVAEDRRRHPRHGPSRGGGVVRSVSVPRGLHASVGEPASVARVAARGRADRIGRWWGDRSEGESFADREVGPVCVPSQLSREKGPRQVSDRCPETVAQAHE